jgi:hypothetical protein
VIAGNELLSRAPAARACGVRACRRGDRDSPGRREAAGPLGRWTGTLRWGTSGNDHRQGDERGSGPPGTSPRSGPGKRTSRGPWAYEPNKLTLAARPATTPLPAQATGAPASPGRPAGFAWAVLGLAWSVRELCGCGRRWRRRSQRDRAIRAEGEARAQGRGKASERHTWPSLTANSWSRFVRGLRAVRRGAAGDHQTAPVVGLWPARSAERVARDLYGPAPGAGRGCCPASAQAYLAYMGLYDRGRRRACWSGGAGHPACRGAVPGGGRRLEDGPVLEQMAALIWRTSGRTPRERGARSGSRSRAIGTACAPPGSGPEIRVEHPAAGHA